MLYDPKYVSVGFFPEEMTYSPACPSGVMVHSVTGVPEVTVEFEEPVAVVLGVVPSQRERLGSFDPANPRPAMQRLTRSHRPEVAIGGGNSRRLR